MTRSSWKQIELASKIRIPIHLGLPFFDKYHFKVHVCVSLGELPSDHGLTLEEIDFMRRALIDTGVKKFHYTDEKFFYSYGDSGWIWRLYESI